LVTAFLLVGMGTGITETSTNDTIMGSVSAENAGAASAISETGYELGAALGTAVLGSVLTAAYRANLDLTGLWSSGAESARETLGGALTTANQLPAPQGSALRDSAVTAFTSGIHVTSAVSVVILCYTAAQAWWVLRRAQHHTSIRSEP